MKNAKKEKVQKKSGSKLLLYLFLLVAAMFLLSKLDITGFAGKKTSISITPTITAGNEITLNVFPGAKGVKADIDVYKNKIRVCQACWSVCKDSKCIAPVQFKERVPDGWETGTYSIRVYEWGETIGNYKEVFFNVKGYPPAVQKEHY